MALREIARKSVRLNRAGGSRSVVLPTPWLRKLHLDERAELIFTQEGILVAPPHEEVQSIEDEPEFAVFMDFLLRSALARPETLVNAVEFTAGDEDLVAGVAPDD
jgi:hypothetical protein